MSEFKLLQDRDEKRAQRASWYVEGPGGSTGFYWSRGAAIVAAARKWPELAGVLPRWATA
jgi:hypothetical protein